MRYRTIVADPPWYLPTTGPCNRDGWSPGERVRLPYPTMSLDEIRALPVVDFAEDDAHLYLWTINRYIRSAFDVADSWGFRFSTMLTWCKPSRGIGFGGTHTITTEHVLFCRRGTMKAKRRTDRTWYEWPRGAHSAKPEAFLDLVEQVSPGPYLELFTRRQRLGWDTWGNECRCDVEMRTT